jgi:hypothetical protein
MYCSVFPGWDGMNITRGFLFWLMKGAVKKQSILGKRAERYEKEVHFLKELI